MSIFGTCETCRSDTVNYLCPDCQAKRIVELEAEVERLRTIVEAIQHGTAEAFVKATFDLAERECGQSPLSSEPPTVFIERELTRLRAENTEMKSALELMGKMESEVYRLQEVIAQHELCHDLHGKVDALDFARGCEAEQRRIYGCAPHAEKIEEARKLLSRWVNWLERSGPNGSNQWEKFDGIHRDTLGFLG